MLVENVRFLAGYRRSRLVDEAPLDHAFARAVIGGHLIPVICRPTCSMRSISGLPTGPRVRRIATLLVSIHDGMFRKGSGSEASYRGISFARHGVVCATIAYRLAAEGFLYLDDSTANLGLLDQVAALEWVQGNIAAFGGDPGKVTVAGAL